MFFFCVNIRLCLRSVVTEGPQTRQHRDVARHRSHWEEPHTRIRVPGRAHCFLMISVHHRMFFFSKIHLYAFLLFILNCIYMHSSKLNIPLTFSTRFIYSYWFKHSIENHEFYEANSLQWMRRWHVRLSAFVLPVREQQQSRSLHETEIKGFGNDLQWCQSRRQ